MKFLRDLAKKRLKGKICLLRVDLNIEKADEKTSLRIKAILPTLEFLIKRGVKVLILSHRGRPDGFAPSLSLKNFTLIFGRLFKKNIPFFERFDFAEIRRLLEAAPAGSVFFLENLRFLKGEEENDPKLAESLASLGDFYVNDAFAVCHRANASVDAIAGFLPSFVGLLLEAEIKNLRKAITAPQKPLVMILGGAKISDKIGLINKFFKKADYFLVGGGIANTILAAKGTGVGVSLYEKNVLDFAVKLAQNEKIIAPADVVVAKKVDSRNIGAFVRMPEDIGDAETVLDIGPRTVRKFGEILREAKTVVWNGPLGFCEDERFARGSRNVLKIIAGTKAFSVIGGGETTALVEKMKIGKKFGFVSTGGGAMLEFLSGKKLPGLAALEKSRIKLTFEK